MRHKWLYFGLLLLLPAASCFTAKKTVTGYHARFRVIDSTLARDPSMDTFLQPYRLQMDSVMSLVVGYCAVPLSKAQPECTMGNFMADAQLAMARKIYPDVAFSVMNYGGMRISYVAPGALTKGRIYEMMPFDNKLAIVDIPGKVLQQFCDHMAAWGGWPVSGITYQIRNGKAIHIRIGGSPLSEQDTYVAAVSDYIADGGDSCTFLVPCKRRIYNIFVRDMLMAYVSGLYAKGLQLNPQIENRVTHAE